MNNQIYNVTIGKYLSKEKGKKLHELPPVFITEVICIMYGNYMVNVNSTYPNVSKYEIIENDDINSINCMDYYVIKKEIYDVSKLKLLEKLKLARKVALLRKALEPDYRKYK